MNGPLDQLGGILGNSGINPPNPLSPLMQMFSQSPIAGNVQQGMAPLRALGSLMQPQQSDAFNKNMPFLKPGADNFQTTLPPLVENQFRGWAGQNNVPMDNPGYDMRGLYSGMMSGHPQANGFSPQSGNFPHFWTTPYHSSFSNQSQWANQKAPAPSGDFWSPQ